MPLVFFSGGIDSTVLAYDIATRPWRYGVDDDEELILFSYGSKKKTAQLKPLVSHLQQCRQTRLEVLARVEPVPLEPYEPPGAPPHWQTLDPLTTKYRPEYMPFTPGLHVWLASWAFNLLGYEHRPPNPPSAFFGFQFNGPAWIAHDQGTMPKNDTTQAFVDSLNRTSSASGASVVFRAPFLENRMSKDQIVKLGAEVGAPLPLTSSCVQGWKKDCGVCPQCLYRQPMMHLYEEEKRKWQTKRS